MAANDSAVQNGTEKLSTNALTTVNGVTVTADVIEVQRIKVGFGSDGALRDVDASNGLPVVGTFWQATQPVSLTSTTITGSVAVTGSLTDTQLRAVAVPVSGSFFQATQPVSTTSLPLPAGAATEATLALVSGADITTPSPAMPAGGVGIRGWLSAIWTKLNASLAVTGTFWQATQPVSLATLPVTNAGTFAVQAAATLAAETTKVIGTVNLSAAQTLATVTNLAQMGGVAISLNAGVVTTGTQRVTLATDVVLPALSEARAATLHVTATAAVNTAITATLPAAGVGLFHYITSIQLVKLYAVVGVASGAGVIITSTNLPGTPAWTTEQVAGVAGIAPQVINYQPTTPLKSSAANIATTFVAPAQLQTIWRWNISYFTAA